MSEYRVYFLLSNTYFGNFFMAGILAVPQFYTIFHTTYYNQVFKSVYSKKLRVTHYNNSFINGQNDN